MQQGITKRKTDGAVVGIAGGAAALLALLSGCGSGDGVSLVKAAGESVTTESCSVEVTSDRHDGVRLRFSAPAPTLSSAVLDGDRYTALSAEGCVAFGATGAPELPVLHKLVAVPRGFDAEMTIVSASEATPLALGAPLAFRSREEIHGGAEVWAQKNVDAYAKAYGEASARLEATSWMGAARAASLTFEPLFYDAMNGTAAWTSTVEVDVTFVPVAAETAAERAPVAAWSEDAAAIAAAVVVNPSVVDGDAKRLGRSPSAQVDLVIAASMYQTALEPLLAAKRAAGRQVRVEYVARATTSEAMAIIRREYAAATPPSHVLLVGSIDQIAAWRQSGIWTDVNYSLLDSGNLPDISVARIPAQTAAELSTYVAKAIARASTPRNKEAFLLTAGADTSLGCPTNVDRVGRLISQYRPSAALTKLYRSNGASQSQIIGGWNASPNVIVYDGHGDSTGMIEIPLQINHLPTLTNAVYPIVLDIACLNANWPSGGATRRNFAESTLFLAEHGTAAIIAAGGNSGGHSFFQRIATHMTKDRTPAFAGAGAPVPDEIGSIVLAAKMESGWDDNYMFNVYGDPALGVFQ
jgi:hypothetical protein